MIRLFRVFIPKSILALVLGDAALITGCFIASLNLLNREPGEVEIYLLYETGGLSVTLAVLSIMAALYFQDLYTNFRVRSRILMIQQHMLVVGVGFLFQALLSYVNPEWILPRGSTLTACALLMVVMPLWRWSYGSVIYKGLGSERVVFVGASPVGLAIAKELRSKPELGLTCLGFIDETASLEDGVDGFPVLGRTADLTKAASEVKPDRIVISLAEQRQALPVNTLLDLRFAGFRIEEAASLYEVAFGRVMVRNLRPSQLIFSTELGPRRWSRRLQTLYSYVIGLIGLILTLPLMAVVAVVVRFSSPGPIFYRQKRVGLNSVPFTLYKFRSMVADAEAKTGAVWATRHDPRVTRVGRFLRKTRIDELPQLFNVMRGEMSIVGPRPERPEFVAVLSEQIPFYRQRHCVKPGVTGWAQVSYKYGETVEDTITKLEYDLYYIKNLSPSLDAFIIFHTVKVMLFSQHGQ